MREQFSHTWPKEKKAAWFATAQVGAQEFWPTPDSPTRYLATLSGVAVGESGFLTEEQAETEARRFREMCANICPEID